MNQATNVYPHEHSIPFNKWSHSIKFGVIGGILVGLYQLFLNSSSGEVNIGLGIIGFFLLVPVLFAALREIKKHYHADSFFKHAFISSIYISFIAALVTGLFDFASYLMSATGGFWELNNPEANLLINVIFQILIGIVFGNILAFVIMQGLKTNTQVDKSLE